MRKVDPPKLAERPAFAAEAGASADSAEEMKDTPGVGPGRLHFFFQPLTLAFSFLGDLPRRPGGRSRSAIAFHGPL